MPLRDPRRIRDVLFGFKLDNTDFDIIFHLSGFGNFVVPCQFFLGESCNIAQRTAGGCFPGPQLIHLLTCVQTMHSEWHNMAEIDWNIPTRISMACKWPTQVFALLEINGDGLDIVGNTSHIKRELFNIGRPEMHQDQYSKCNSEKNTPREYYWISGRKSSGISSL